MDRLTASDFQQSPLWAGYYEPDDLQEIAQWAAPIEAARAALEAVGWADDQYFPLPLAARDTTWMRGKLFGASAAMPDGTQLAAFVGEQRSYVVVFVGSDRFVLSNDTPAEKQRLAEKLGSTPTPLRIKNHVTGDEWVHTLA